MTSTVTAPRVLIVDDQALFRAGLNRLLDCDERVEVVGVAADGSEAIRKVVSLNPDIVLMDLQISDLDGIEATRKIVADHPGVRVLVLTSLEAGNHFIEAHRAGASGYILKDSQAGSIVSSILAVAAGEWVMSSSVASRMLEMLTGTTEPKELFYNGLTTREIEVLTMLAGGMANKEIAYKLRLSHKTVRNHVSNMYEKLQIYDRSQAVLYAIRKGLVNVDA